MFVLNYFIVKHHLPAVKLALLPLLYIICKIKIRAAVAELAYLPANALAQVVKLVDTLALGASGSNPLEVRVLSWA